MNRNYFSILILFLLFYFNASGQPALQVSSGSLVQASMAFHLPAGNLSERFGSIFSAGPSFMYKTDGNWLWGIEGDYLFGNVVKEDDLFKAISTEQGYIIDAGGVYADVYTSMRGFRVGAKTGKLFPLSATDLNSGLLIMGGIGLLQHKIRIDNAGDRAPQLDEAYLKGYDRLSNGLSLTASAGYLHLSQKRIANYYLGFEFTSAFTQSRRDWDFDKMSKDETKRFDLMIGFKAGWLLPLYGSSKQKTYYY